MDQELKQRLIGAAVITALAAIFVPMLFDDPIDETGKSINELKIPELPAKVQDVEIMPLPEKVEDVATTPAPIEKPMAAAPGATAPAPAFVEEGTDEAELEAPRPKLRLSSKETAVPPQPAQVLEPDMDVAEAEGVAAAKIEAAKPADKPTKPPVSPAQSLPPAKVLKPQAKAPEIKPAPVVEPAAKPVAPAAETATTRWYLNAGSFSQKANAVTLQDTLKQQGFAASIKEVAGEKGTVFKVRIGPMLDKAKAQAVKAKLAQINVNSFVSGDE